MIAGKFAGFENEATTFSSCIQEVQPSIYSDIKNTYTNMLNTINDTSVDIRKESSQFIEDLSNNYAKESALLHKNLNVFVEDKRNMDDRILSTRSDINSTMTSLNNTMTSLNV